MSTFKVGDRVRYIPYIGGEAWQNVTITRIDDGGYWGDDDNEAWRDGYFPFSNPRLELIPPPTPNPETRALDLIRRIAAHDGKWGIEARAIMRDVEPDGDLIEARKIAAKRWNGDGAGYGGPDLAKNIDNGECDDLWYFKPVYDAIKRGRAMERGEA